MDTSPRFHALVPAAGVGARMGGGVPKQYLELAGRSLLQWSVDVLSSAPFVESVWVVVAPEDTLAEAQLCNRPGVRVLRQGGASRRDTVLAGLEAAEGHWRDDDWVLVHDAARPGLSLAALTRLRDALQADALGGLLALPVSDTVKASIEGEQVVARTLPREGLWLAQTPQMFRYGPLLDALRRHPDVTDEAGAIEAAGGRPRLVAGERRNFKVTTRDDLDIMAALLTGPQAGPNEASRALPLAGSGR